jgi:hypothetical protein
MSGKDQKGLEATRGIEKFSSLYPVWDTVKRVAQPALDRMIEESQGESESTRKLQTLGQIERDAKIAADKSVKTHKPDPDWAKKGW